MVLKTIIRTEFSIVLIQLKCSKCIFVFINYKCRAIFLRPPVCNWLVLPEPSALLCAFRCCSDWPKWPCWTHQCTQTQTIGPGITRLGSAERNTCTRTQVQFPAPPTEEAELLDFVRLELNKAKYSKSRHLGFVYWICFAMVFVLWSLFSFWVESATQLITEVSHPEFNSYYQKKREDDI